MHVKDASFVVRGGRRTPNMNFNFSIIGRTCPGFGS